MVSRFVRGALLVSVGIGVFLGPVGRADAASSPSPSPRGITLSPAHSIVGQSASRAYFLRSLAPGKNYSDQIRVTNGSLRPVTLDVVALDGLTAATSGVVYDQTPIAGDSGWLRLASSHIVLPALSSRLLGFTVQVPLGATPGDHLAGIAFTDPIAQSRTRGPLTIRTLYRNVIGVETVVSGPAVARFALPAESLAAGPGTGLATATVTIDNVGQLLDRSTLTVSLQAGSYRRLVTRRLGVILARQSIGYVVDWPTGLPAGGYTMTSELSGTNFPTVRLVRTVTLAQPAPGGTAAPIRAFAVPAPVPAAATPGLTLAALVALGLLGVTLAGLAAFLLRRRRQADAVAPPVPVDENDLVDA